jgi:hypothetical protein
MKKKRIPYAVAGVLLVLFGLTGSIPILLNQQYILGLIATALAVVIGVLLIAWAVSE